MKNGIVKLITRIDVASVIGFDLDGQGKQVTLALQRLGTNLFSQVIAICDDRQWSDCPHDAFLRMYLAACAFMAALESQMESRERIMRTLIDFIVAQERRSRVQTPIVDFLSARAEGTNLQEGERWHPTFIRIEGQKKTAPKRHVTDTTPCASTPP
jgi:hypothetical protein